MLMEQVILKGVSNDISSTDEGTFLKFVVGVEGPKFVLVEGRDIDTAGDEDTLGHLSDSLQWTLDTIKDRLENT